MIEIRPVLANRYREILGKLDAGETIDVNAIMHEWLEERTETGRRITEKLHFLYDLIGELQNKLDERE